MLDGTLYEYLAIISPEEGVRAGQSYTIYAKVEEDPDLSRLLSNLKKVLSNYLKGGKNPAYCPSTKAHLTIAKGISKHDFEKAWPGWKNKLYQASFKADRMLLLRRAPASMFRKFDRIAELIFHGKPMETAQTTLF